MLCHVTDSAYHDFSPDQFDQALDSARETLRKALLQFQNAAIATEHKELFGYYGKSGRGKGIFDLMGGALNWWAFMA